MTRRYPLEYLEKKWAFRAFEAARKAVDYSARSVPSNLIEREDALYAVHRAVEAIVYLEGQMGRTEPNRYGRAARRARLVAELVAGESFGNLAVSLRGLAILPRSEAR